MLGYADDLAPGDDGPAVAIKDPTRIGPAFWFQQMDEPRTERNRFHIDVIVPHEIAQERIDAARAAGGVVVTVRPVVVGAGRHRGQRSLCLHLAGPRVGVSSPPAVTPDDRSGIDRQSRANLTRQQPTPRIS